MPSPPIDLRSDTVTRPTPAMRRAMAEAEVGDDVLNEDPTVRRLQEKTAELFGKEAALFVPSGTMANQLAVGVHARAGDELVCDPSAHVYVWEGGGIARLWGVTARSVEPAEGLLSLPDLRGKVRPDDSHYVRTRMIALENTHNRAGGRVHPITEHRRGLRLGPGAPPGDAPGRGPDHECRGGQPDPGGRVGPVLRHGLRSAIPRAWGPRSARPWSGRATRSRRPTGSGRSSGAGCVRPG